MANDEIVNSATELVNATVESAMDSKEKMLDLWKTWSNSASIFEEQMAKYAKYSTDYKSSVTSNVEDFNKMTLLAKDIQDKTVELAKLIADVNARNWFNNLGGNLFMGKTKRG